MYLSHSVILTFRVFSERDTYVHVRYMLIRRTTVQNLTPQALSSAEKSVTVQTHKNKQKTLTDVSTTCLSACVEKI